MKLRFPKLLERFRFQRLRAAEHPVWTYYCGLPDRSGLTEYTHLIRHPSDGTRESRAARQKRLGVAEAAMNWKQLEKVPTKDWCAAIDTLMEDGEPRTFNGITLALTRNEMTADVAPDKLDDALWVLVEKKILWWACEDGAVFFLHENFVSRDT